MKFLLLTIALLAASVTSQAKEVVIAISPHFSPSANSAMLNDMASIYGGLGLGDTLTFLNGSDASEIASITIPKEDAYRHRVPKLRHGAKALARLNAYIQSMAQGSRTLGAMDAPLVLSQIARNYPASTDIVLIGSALYDNPRQPGVNMASKHIPSDGFITAKPTDSPFGTKGRETQLRGKRIHWRLPQVSDDSLHGEALVRFMHLYLHHMGGELISFTHNQKAVTQLLLSGAQPMAMRYELETSGKMFMQAIRQLVPEQSLYQAPIKQPPLPQERLNTKQRVSIGIEWQGDVDLDIYAWPQGGEVLYYGHTRSEFGQHYKDVLSGHSNVNNKQYETIEFHAPIDVRALIIGVNVYSVRQDWQSAQLINGTLRLQLSEHIYAKPFVFETTGGNKGHDIEAVLNGSEDSAHSKRFTIKEIINAAEVSL